MVALAVCLGASGLLLSPGVAGAASPTVVAAGDIACAPASSVTATTCQQGATGSLVQGLNPTVVAALGDEQYDSGTAAEFSGAFDGSWGAFRSLIRPAPGNHEYLTAGAAGYFGYFGTAAGDPSRGFYSYDVGAWHVLALNSNCEFVSCAAGSEQERWVRADLAAHPAICTLAYWHHPLFTSGPTGGGADNLATRPLWQALYDGGADLILNGHDHDYERFALQDPGGQPDLRGIREIVVGTGGKSHFAVGALAANSQAHDDASFGALQLTLDPQSYSWQFVPAAGSSYTDSGTTACYDAAHSAVPSHLTPPLRIGLVIARQRLAQALASGLRVAVITSHPGRVELAALLNRPQALAFGFPRPRGLKRIAVALHRGRTTGRHTTFKVVFSRSARRRLAHARHLSLILTAALTTRDGRRAVQSRHITLSALTTRP